MAAPMHCIDADLFFGPAKNKQQRGNTMKKILLAAALLSAVSLPAFAQTTDAQAVDTPVIADPATPEVAPATSEVAPAEVSALTEEKVKELVAAAGYTDAGTFAQDDTGAWKGAASKDGATFAVTVDAQGAVTAE